MASLKDLIMGRDQDKERIRKESENFQGQYAPDSDAPPEEGIEESSLDEKPMIGPTGEPVKMGMIPFGPGAGVGLAGEEAAAGSGGLIKKLLSSGYDEGRINEAAENLRLQGSHTFPGAAGRPAMTVGERSPLGQELKQLGRDRMRTSNANAPAYNYKKKP